MKTITFYADTNRSDDLLHIETDGCVINLHVGLNDREGRRVTRVDIIPDDERRGGDGLGDVWEIAPDSGVYGIRIVRGNRDQP